tara:strand:+ start:72 stop:374 length:303 start_codon:yes stop_codon:yes gene_type:complete
MNGLNFVITLSIIFLVHLALASTILFQFSKVISNLQHKKNNKFTAQKISKLKAHKPLVLLVPIIGPIIGFGIIKGLNTGIPEKGLLVNSPGKTDICSDGD